MFNNITTESLVKSLLMLILDGHGESPDFTPMLQECKKRLQI